MTLDDVKDIEIVKRVLASRNLLKEYVILHENKYGRRFVMYAFTDGAPDNNDCLSWYFQPHPKLFKTFPYSNGWLKPWEHEKIEIGHIYKLQYFTCGHHKEGDGSCMPGKIRKECGVTITSGWTYDEPKKCACYNLEYCEDDEFDFCLSKKEIETCMETPAYTHYVVEFLDKDKKDRSVYLRTKEEFAHGCIDTVLTKTIYMEKATKFNTVEAIKKMHGLKSPYKILRLSTIITEEEKITGD